MFGVAIRFTFPQFSQNGVRKAGDIFGRVIGARCRHEPVCGHGRRDRATGAFHRSGWNSSSEEGQRKQLGQPADYNIPLEKGDVVQTGSEGMAKVVFNDGTSYTVKQDSLIVIEENSANDQHKPMSQ